jgi:hypothetical protein
MALFKSAENDYLLFGNVRPPSRALQLLGLSYLKVLAALARAGVPFRRGGGDRIRTCVVLSDDGFTDRCH